ncbi:MAG: histidine phosphatase family protein [Deltaproteobacteria bacterium]|nr:histidine phosphatase family protein [Deltaproteobacteria bacterium]
MKLFLVRHAKAFSRNRWREDDELRPLTPAGDLQAEAIATALAEEHPRRLISSPHVRCVQTLEPLAQTTGLRIEQDARLAEGATLDGAALLLASLAAEPVVLCGHGDLLPVLLASLDADGVKPSEIECEKGSFWRVEADAGERPRATYWLPRDTSGAPSRRVGGPRAQRLAVLDLGSSSFHLLVADAEPGGAIHRVGRERVMLRLGALITEGGKIPRSAADAAVETVSQMRKDAADAGADRVIAVATAALRDATNSREVVARLSEALDERVRVLSGEEEARLIFRAIAQRLSLNDERALGIDLGGGSLELALGANGEVRWERSLPIGSVRIHQELGRDDPLTSAQQEAIAARVRDSLAPLRERVEGFAAQSAVAIGGTVRALYRLANALDEDTHRIPPDARLRRSELDALVAKLADSTHAGRMRMRGMSARRADLLPTGALIVREILRSLGLREVAVCDWGLREGVILDAIARS